MKKLLLLLQILFLGAAIYLGNSLYVTVRQPMKFDKVKAEKYDAVVARLKNIRKAELAYKDKFGEFSSDWDSLITFVKTDSLAKVRKIGALTDSLYEAGYTEEKAIKEGLIIRDTIFVAVQEEVFTSSFNADDLRYIPNLEEKVEFFLGKTKISTTSGVVIPVFEARAHNNQIFGVKRNPSTKEVESIEIGIEYEQILINLNESRRINNKYPGIKVGSLLEANNNAGNWE